ncbi:MAG: SDR family NAD(P)-dependent oxidoreductase, partial [bacterium]
EPPKETTGLPSRAQALQRKPDIADWFYVPSWSRTQPAAYCERLDEPPENTSWLIFSDALGLGDAIAKKLRAANRQVVVVEKGEKFTRKSEGVYTLDPQHRENYDALIKSLVEQQMPPGRIVHLWSTPGDCGSGISDFGSENSSIPQSAIRNPNSVAGFFSLLYLAQALGNQKLTSALHISVVTGNVFSVIGEESLFPQNATVLGVCRTLPFEYPNITCRAIDLDFVAYQADMPENLLDSLLVEFEANTPEQVVAYRNNLRWTPDWKPVRLPEKMVVNRVREEGVYLITGGLGGIGLELAAYLVRTVKAKLVLTARSEMPPKENWDVWLTEHDQSDRTSRKIRKVRALEEMGSEVLLASADIADLEQMKRVIEQTKKRFGAIHGVIHAAGIAGGGIVQLRTREQAEAVLVPKVNGTLVLADLLAPFDLDFVVLCSSLAAVLGGAGQADYCTANAFLDAFAQSWSAQAGYPVVAIDWDTWGEAGMAVETEVPDNVKAGRAQAFEAAIKSREGVEAFVRALNAGLPQIAVSPQDLPARIASINAAQQQKEVAPSEQPVDAAVPEAEAKHQRPAMASDYVAPRNDLEQKLATIWQELLGIDRVGIHDNFLDLGGHSLLALQML